MSYYFPKSFKSFGRDINVKVGLCNYATKTYLKNVTHVDTSSFALKTNLANLKTEVDKLDIDKLVPVPVDLSKLSDGVKNEVVKKTVYDKLVAKINNIDTSRFVLKTKYDADKTRLEKKIPDTSKLVKKTVYDKLVAKVDNINTSGFVLKTKCDADKRKLEKKIPDTSRLVKKSDYNAKVSEIEGKIRSISGLATTSAAENKIPSVTNLVKKTDYDTKISEL